MTVCEANVDPHRSSTRGCIPCVRAWTGPGSLVGSNAGQITQLRQLLGTDAAPWTSVTDGTLPLIVAYARSRIGFSFPFVAAVAAALTLGRWLSKRRRRWGRER